MEILTSKELAKKVPDNWASVYEKRYGDWPDKEVIADKLKALKKKELTPEKVNEIIGNNSWTTIHCNECEIDADEAIALKGYYICKDCFRKAVAIWARFK